MIVASDQSATFSNVRITTNSVVALNDNFAVAPLNVSASGLWRNRSQNPGGVTVVTTNGLFWLRWTVPNMGFSLQTPPIGSGPGLILTHHLCRRRSYSGVGTLSLRPQPRLLSADQHDTVSCRHSSKARTACRGELAKPKIKASARRGTRSLATGLVRRPRGKIRPEGLHVD